MQRLQKSLHRSLTFSSSSRWIRSTWMAFTIFRQKEWKEFLGSTSFCLTNVYLRVLQGGQRSGPVMTVASDHSTELQYSTMPPCEDLITIYLLQHKVFLRRKIHLKKSQIYALLHISKAIPWAVFNRPILAPVAVYCHKSLWASTVAGPSERSEINKQRAEVKTMKSVH